jgi:hypothetical protein
MRRRLRRPTPAMLIGLLALVVALGGTATAAVLINGSQLTNRSVGAIKIKKDTLGGAEISEKRLGKVPAAQRAQNVGGYAASGLIRSAYASSNTSSPVQGTSATFLTAVIRAPVNGFLIVVTNTIFANTEDTAPLIHCGLDVDGTGPGTWPGNFAASQSVDMGIGITPEFSDGCNPTSRFPVKKGIHRVRYQAHNDGGGSLHFQGGSLTVLFEPFGAMGNPGTGTATLARPVARGDVNRRRCRARSAHHTPCRR